MMVRQTSEKNRDKKEIKKKRSKGRGEAKLSAGEELLFLTLQSAGEGA